MCKRDKRVLLRALELWVGYILQSTGNTCAFSGCKNDHFRISLAQELLALFTSKGRKHRHQILQNQEPQWTVFIQDVLDELELQDPDSIRGKWLVLKDKLGTNKLMVSSCYLIAAIIRFQAILWRCFLLLYVLQTWIGLATLVVADHFHVPLDLQRDDFVIAPRVSTWQSHLKTLTQYQGFEHHSNESELDYRKKIVGEVRKALPRASKN
jgi:hypothetical protein